MGVLSPIWRAPTCSYGQSITRPEEHDMFNTHSHRTASTVVAGIFGLTLLALAPAPANATRIPADPITFVPTPTALAQLVTDGHAANVRAAIQELRSDVAGQ
jgi:hypothetical protein